MYDGFKAPMTDIYLDRLVSDLGAERKAARKEACRILVQYQEDKVVRRLIKELKNNDPNVRGNAAYVLGRMGNREAEKDLIPLLEDEHPGVKLSACNALGEVGGQAAEDVLIRFVGDSFIGEQAREAIESIRERNEREKKKNGSGKKTIVDLGREGVIPRERKEFMEKATALLDRMQRIARNEPPEPAASRKTLRRHTC